MLAGLFPPDLVPASRYRLVSARRSATVAVGGLVAAGKAGGMQWGGGALSR